MDFACIQCGYVTVPLYDTLGKKSIEFIVDQTEMATIACSQDKIKNLVKLKSENKAETLKNVICFDEPFDDTKKQCQENGLKLWYIHDLVEKGKDADVELQAPDPNDIYTICYTSGTTGDPKGVLVTHKNTCSTLGGVKKYNVDFFEDDVHLSFLPMAHVFERLFYLCIVNAGGRIGYFQGDIKKLKDDIQELKPTIFASVPRLLNKFYEKMISTIEDQSIVPRTFINWAVWSKTWRLDSSGEFHHWVYDKLVFGRFRDVLGGRVRMIITGSAPISKETIKFLKVAFSCEIYEAYGQTETGGASFATHPYDPELGHVGGPGPHNEFKLVDCKDLGYTSKDEVDGKICQRGELCVRGPSVFPGYFKLPDKTKETIDEDGWVHSGDIAEILDNGAIRIIDRKKNLFKLAQGEYIAAEKLESAYSDIDAIKQICVYGDSLQHYLVAIVVPEEAKDEDSINDEEFHKSLIEKMKKVKDSEGFNSYEVPEKIYCTTEEFSEENGLMTPTHKVKRNEVKKKYLDEIKEMYDGAKLQGEE